MFLLVSMGPPGGGRMHISNRLQSRFNLINMTFPAVRFASFDSLFHFDSLFVQCVNSTVYSQNQSIHNRNRSLVPIRSVN